MIRVRYLRSFHDSVAALHEQDRAAVLAAVARLLDYFAGGPKAAGMGLRKLRSRWWEVRASLDKRILFLLDGGALTFVIVGNHDEIRRVLKK